MKDDTENDRPVVAHLVTPYLFLTGSWIHAQLVHNSEFRPIVLTQRTENLELFPLSKVHDLAPRSRGLRRPGHLLLKYLAGTYPLAPYRDILERESARILHAHFGWEGARLTGLSRDPRRPLVVSFYGRDAGLLPRKAYWRALYGRLFRSADRFIAEGPHMAEVLESIGAPREHIRVVRLGIPLERFPFSSRAVPADPDAPIVGLMAASFREKKGIPYALEALARLAARHPRVRLRIIGDGPERGRIEALSRRSELRGRVDLLGYQPYDIYCRELAAAQFLIAPSVTARDGDTEGGAPVCLLEAQASGLPIVATTHCDIPDVTVPGESALLAPEGDVEALAGCLEELLSHPEHWPEMGRVGRAHVEAEFDIRRQVGRMNQLYRELL